MEHSSADAFSARMAREVLDARERMPKAIRLRDRTLDRSALQVGDWVEWRANPHVTHIGKIVRLMDRWPDSVMRHPGMVVQTVMGGTQYDQIRDLEDVVRRAPRQSGRTAATVSLRAAPTLDQVFTPAYFMSEVAAFHVLPDSLSDEMLRRAARGLVVVYANMSDDDQVACADVWQGPRLQAYAPVIGPA
jgi:hypothetical protein